MQYQLRKVLDFLIFSNVFIALCAVAQGLVTYHLLGVEPVPAILALLFFATLTVYNFSTLIQKASIHKRSVYRRVRWTFWHYRLIVSVTIIATLSLIPLFLFLSLSAKVFLIFLGLISIGYSLPLFSINNKKFGLRNIPGLKLFLIALVWSASTVTLPIIEINEAHLLDVNFQDIILLSAKRFLFIAAITVPFDIRDFFQDKIYELKTIPTVFGERKAYLFCQLLLLAYLILLFIFNKGFDFDFLALTSTIILTGWLIFKSNWKKNEYYYFLFLDGMMILQYAMLLLFSFIRLATEL